MAVSVPNLQFNNPQQQMPNQFSQAQLQMNNNFPQNIFMQPIGNIYGLGNSNEVGNIPIGNGVSVGLCLSEGTMYLKSMQNNGPVLLGYKISPLENTQNVSSGTDKNKNDDLLRIEKLLQQYEEHLLKLEKKIENKGGNKQWEV